MGQGLLMFRQRSRNSWKKENWEERAVKDSILTKRNRNKTHYLTDFFHFTSVSLSNKGFFKRKNSVCQCFDSDVIHVKKSGN